MAHIKKLCGNINICILLYCIASDLFGIIDILLQFLLIFGIICILFGQV